MKWVCKVCGYVHEGPTPPAICPVCKAPAERFETLPGGRSWADDHRVGVAKGLEGGVVAALRVAFGKASADVGVYRAMVRAAERDGYPEAAYQFARIADEKANHAARLAELLGEQLSDSTSGNLAVRVEAEFDACKEKRALADRARELGYDTIHDALHEMCKDEARHGRALDGLQKRLFDQ